VVVWRRARGLGLPPAIVVRADSGTLDRVSEVAFPGFTDAIATCLAQPRSSGCAGPLDLDRKAPCAYWSDTPRAMGRMSLVIGVSASLEKRSAGGAPGA
jgi:hypothetical protein